MSITKIKRGMAHYIYKEMGSNQALPIMQQIKFNALATLMDTLDDSIFIQMVKNRYEIDFHKMMQDPLMVELGIVYNGEINVNKLEEIALGTIEKMGGKFTTKDNLTFETSDVQKLFNYIKSF